MSFCGSIRAQDNDYFGLVCRVCYESRIGTKAVFLLQSYFYLVAAVVVAVNGVTIFIV